MERWFLAVSLETFEMNQLSPARLIHGCQCTSAIFTVHKVSRVQSRYRCERIKVRMFADPATRSPVHTSPAAHAALLMNYSPQVCESRRPHRSDTSGALPSVSEQRPCSRPDPVYHPTPAVSTSTSSLTDRQKHTCDVTRAGLDRRHTWPTCAMSNERLH